MKFPEKKNMDRWNKNFRKEYYFIKMIFREYIHLQVSIINNYMSFSKGFYL